MPSTHVVFYQKDDRTVPVLDWLESLPPKAQDKCVVKIERLRELGHELRRPETEFLRDGIYELRAGLRRMNYRILYFFHGKGAVWPQGPSATPVSWSIQEPRSCTWNGIDD